MRMMKIMTMLMIMMTMMMIKMMLELTRCREMLRGSASDWDGHETFHAETEVCAARVVQPRLEELQVTSLPRSFRDVEDKGGVKKLHRPELTSLPQILGGRDGCQVRESEERDCQPPPSQGDSGGPLWRWRKGRDGVKRAVQIGIISRGQKCARINRPGEVSLLPLLPQLCRQVSTPRSPPSDSGSRITPRREGGCISFENQSYIS